MALDTNKFSEIVKFFDDIGLPKYSQVFIDNGIEDVETLVELQEEHLEMMKIPLGHKLKIMKRIRELKPVEE